MATLFKKLYMTDRAGTQQTTELYSTTSEAGSAYAHLVVDGTTCYIPLISTSDSSATNGRVTKSNGTTYAIAASAVPAYATRLITSGTGTFTVTSGVTKLRVTCVGGGASGRVWKQQSVSVGGRDNAYDDVSTSQAGHNAGGTTTFGSVSASGASSRTAGYNSGGYKDSIGSVSGGSATPITNYLGTQVASAGAGGGTYFTAWGGNLGNESMGGGSGYRTQSIITVTPGQTISYSVGAGGRGTYYDSKRYTSSGSTGAIYLEWGQGIQ